MNVILPTAVILLFLLPGYLARRGYYSHNFGRRQLPSNVVEVLATIMIWAIPVDCFGLWLIAKIPSFDLVSLSNIISFIIEFSTTHVGAAHLGAGIKILIAYHLLLAFSFFCGVLLGQLSDATGLDKYEFFRRKNRWFYVLFEVSWPFVDVLVTLGDKTELYRGVLKEVITDNNGYPEEFVLTNAYRGADRDILFRWKKIPGERFVIAANQVNNLNVRHFEIDVQEKEPARP